MLKLFFIPGFAALLCFIAGCSTGSAKKSERPKPVADRTVRYAKRFAIARDSSLTYVYLMGKRDSPDTTDTFILYHNNKPANTGEAHCIKVPCKNIAALSCIYAQAFYELRSLGAVKAIDN